MTVAQFKNQHLSFSRLSRFESCPKSYFFHYIEKRQAEPGLPLRFGKMVHAVLERLLEEVVDDERTGPLSEDRALELFAEAWNHERLTGVELFQEGVQILRSFVQSEGIVDHRNLLAVEKEFRLPVGPFTVLGYIDRVDWVDAETIRVVDYKSNHQLFSREEVDSSLQLSLYAIAARRLWPWVKTVQLEFWMLRHGVKQRTTRTEEQLATTLRYVEALGHQTESATDFPARPNTNCCYCDHRHHCPAYAEALAGKREYFAADLADLEAVAREREEVARLSKTLHARQRELDAILKTHLKHRTELVLGSMRYRMFNTASTEYPLARTLDLLAEATGEVREELLERIGAVDKKALEKELKEFGEQLPKTKLLLLRAELDAHAQKTLTPKLWASRIPGAA